MEGLGEGAGGTIPPVPGTEDNQPRREKHPCVGRLRTSSRPHLSRTTATTARCGPCQDQARTDAELNGRYELRLRGASAAYAESRKRRGKPVRFAQGERGSLHSGAGNQSRPDPVPSTRAMPDRNQREKTTDSGNPRARKSEGEVLPEKGLPQAGTRTQRRARADQHPCPSWMHSFHPMEPSCRTSGMPRSGLPCPSTSPRLLTVRPLRSIA